MKKLVSVLVVISMLCSCFSLMAFADGPKQGPTTDYPQPYSVPNPEETWDEDAAQFLKDVYKRQDCKPQRRRGRA